MAGVTNLALYPIGTSALAPLSRNATDLDKLINGTGTVENRAGGILTTWQKLEADFGADATAVLSNYAAFNNTGDWVTGTSYQVNDLWKSGGNWYLVLEAYTSGATAGYDIAGGTVALYQSPGTVWQVGSIAEMEALGALEEGQAIYLSAGGRSGTFHWDGSDLSTEVAADTLQGVYIAPSSDATGASGAWVRVTEGFTPTPFWFGAAGDCVWSRGDTGTATGTDDTAAIKAFLLYITREETVGNVNPNPKSGRDAHIPGGYSFRITERLEFYFDNVNFTGDGWLILDHDDTVGIKISEANARLCVNVNIDALNIISYQSGGTVIDVEDAISLHHSPRLETHGGAAHSVDGLTFHAGQWLYMNAAKLEVSGSPIVVSPDNGRIIDHVYWFDSGVAGDLVGKTVDTEGVILWNYYNDTPMSARTVVIGGCHLRGGAVASNFGIKFRRYDTKGGAVQTGNYNAIYNLYLGRGNWTENVGGIIDYDYARNSIDIENWSHEPNLSGGTMLLGYSGNAVWSIGSITLRGGVPATGYNINGDVIFNKKHQYISNPTTVFGVNVVAAKTSFVQNSVSTALVKYKSNVSISAAATSVDVVHNLALGNPQNFSAIPSWDTTVRYLNVNATTVRFLFGTAPVGAETLYVNLSTGNVS